ncbi:preprotein translocase subunit SecE [Alloscardovia macacae]|uniref:Preprotein translocase subunit SecE n=1 Tax=Alloscardovia macacae TaxID=1160091 RepID=A0A1Y2SVK7_9BIFI|nr:preprotein translocase subunit SecE [Alloscardovia macacae]OTA26239.1 preprotein translocase subunit SecE [Alloscardovia macacae]OTA28899.1 preprotein translocase subunit SecE [Alloscardovia macacae]OZG54581.1 preprotein translocase subunit SecE [Alloscardovia macacae]
MAKSENANVGKVSKPNVFVRIGMFVRQMFQEISKVVAPSGKELLGWSVAVFIFVVLLMLFITSLDFGLGRLMVTLFG